MANAKRIALVTGANKGLGFEMARQLGKAGVGVLLAARDHVLDQIDLRWHDDVALTVVMASKGYPGDYPIYPGASFRPCSHDYTRPFQNERMALGSRGGSYYPGEHQAAFAHKTPCKHGFYQRPIKSKF